MDIYKWWRNLISAGPNARGAQNKPWLQQLVNQTYSTQGTLNEIPRSFRGQGASRVVRPYIAPGSPEHQQAVFDIYAQHSTVRGQQSALWRLGQRIKSAALNLGILPGDRVTYNANPFQGHFNPSNRSDGQEFVSLDIETDDYRRPISISALKFRYNPTTGQFESAGQYQRFYKAHTQDVRLTQSIHGLSPGILNSLRRQQKAGYSKIYNEQEMSDLRQFLGNQSIIVGHNITGFDLPVLFQGRGIPNSTIDTVNAARNVWRNQQNDLDSVFQRLYGKTMAEYGLNHHDANADTIATMLILQKMKEWEGVTGKSIQYIMNNPNGFHLAEINKYLDEAEQVVRGTYRDLSRETDIGEAYMTAQELGFKDWKGDWVPGMHIDKGELPNGDLGLQNEGKKSDAQLIQEAVAEAIRFENEKKSPSSYFYEKPISPEQTFINNFAAWKKASMIQQLARAKSEDEEIALLRSLSGVAGLGEGGDSGDMLSLAHNIRNARARSKQEEFEYQKERRIDKVKRHHLFIDKDDEKIMNAATDFDSLADALEKVTEKSEKWEGVLNSIGNIKLYDINQYVRSAQAQWSGITSAAKGVVPSFVLNPTSRLGDAFFNEVNAKLTGYNAVQRTWASGIGDVIMGVGGAVGGLPGAAIGMGIKGGISAISQVYGNYKQAQMEKKGYDIQNTLNVTGAIFSWIATPFQLLYKATKLLTGSFGLLTNRIKSFIATSMGLMSEMGNPLTEMTGVDYGTYQGLSMVDIASLFNKGTMNATIEDYVKQAKALYTTGEVNTSRMIAASMLGVFNDVYDPNASQDTYMNMANKVLRSMQGQTEEQQANTMYWATRIDSSLPSLLRTAQALGVTDIRTLMDPTQGRNWMYWRPLSEKESQNFRWTQYEWGAATTQLNNSRMRIGDKMWNAFGRDIFNAFNQLVDALANEDWDTALDSITTMWNKVKETVKGLWEGFNKEGGLSDGLEKGLSKIKEWGITAATGIIKLWDDIFTAIVKKLGGLIAYLSTLHLDVKIDKNGLSFGISSISDVVTPDDKTKLYDTRAGQYNSYQVARKDMANLIGLSETLGLSKFASIGDVRDRLTEMSKIPALNAAGDYVMGNGLSWKKVQAYLASKGIMYDNPNEMTIDEIDRIIDTLYAGSAWEYGYAEQAALAKSGLTGHASQEFIYDTPAYRTTQDMLASLDAVLVDSIKSLTGKDTGKVDIIITTADGKTATIQTNNGVVTNMTGVSALTGAGSGTKVDVRAQSNQHY